jgi:hypothetical protein
MNRTATSPLKVYLEIGSRRTFAAALDWPGWCRVGRDETSALQALFDYAPRYAHILRSARLGFQSPADVSAFVVVERLKGTTTTDFGAPDRPPTLDAQPLADAELRRLQAILKACWRACDTAVEQAAGKTLRTGPRGGGRDLARIVEHVVGGEQGYLSALGGKVPRSESAEPSADVIRQTILQTLKASAHGEIEAYGPRGGKRWSPRFFVRRAAWHVLDHVWEIEDRLLTPDE